MGISQPDQSSAPEMLLPDSTREMLTPDQLRDLADAAKQERYRAAYRLQQARLSCPGCGDAGAIL